MVLRLPFHFAIASSFARSHAPVQKSHAPPTSPDPHRSPQSSPSLVPHIELYPLAFSSPTSPRPARPRPLTIPSLFSSLLSSLLRSFPLSRDLAHLSSPSVSFSVSRSCFPSSLPPSRYTSSLCISFFLFLSGSIHAGRPSSLPSRRLIRATQVPAERGAGVRGSGRRGRGNGRHRRAREPAQRGRLPVCELRTSEQHHQRDVMEGEVKDVLLAGRLWLCLL